MIVVQGRRIYLEALWVARKFQQDCGLYPKNPTIEQCTEACVKVGAHSARDQVNAFAVSFAAQHLLPSSFRRTAYTAFLKGL